MPKCSRKLVPSLRVRRAKAADIPAMMDLERQSPAAAHWSQNQYEALFSAASGQPSDVLAWIAEEGEASEILAFLAARRLDTEWELENIVVAEKARLQGVGTLLLDGLVARARAERGSAIFLEVRESNRGARALYRKAGFEEAGLRKSYYSNPAEDAIVLRLALI
jgi:ribosomal-protein-alanine acetyltransferase